MSATDPLIPTPSTPSAPETPPVPEPAPHRAHTYEDDVSKAMNATDAKTVQELLATARAREAAQKDYKTSIHQRKWYGALSMMFLILAVAGFGYALYHYSQLTVETVEVASVGVFPSTAPVVVETTDIRQTIVNLSSFATLDEGKPFLIPLVTDATSLSPIGKERFFSFLEATPTEPFAASLGVVRLGVVNTGMENTPFIIASVEDTQLASKEFLIAEPSLLQWFYKALNIDLATHVAEAGKEFSSTYLSNLPVRMLSSVADPVSGIETPVILYGYASGSIIVIATKPEVLTAVYDTIIRQR